MEHIKPNREIKKNRIIVLEFLRDDDLVKTGKELYDNVLRNLTSEAIKLQPEYYSISSCKELTDHLLSIAFSVKEDEMITLNLESHADEEGFGISEEDYVSWQVLYKYLRKINIACGGLLVVTFSCCLGVAQIIALDPTERAPFFVGIFSTCKIKPYQLIDSFGAFYKSFDHPFKIGKAVEALIKSFTNKGVECPFMHKTSIDLYNEFFSKERIELIAEQYSSCLARIEGIDEECAKYQIIEDMKEDYIRKKPYFNFFDVLRVEDSPIQNIFEKMSNTIQ